MHRMTTDKASLPGAAKLPPAVPDAPQPVHRSHLRRGSRDRGHRADQRAAIPSGTTDAQVTAYIDDLAGGRASDGLPQADLLQRLGRAPGRSGTVDRRGLHVRLVSVGAGLRPRAAAQLPARAVADYPDMRSPALAGKARGVYEFDAADIPGSYIYPAMARSFRSGGAQFAAQFQYDPLPLAPVQRRLADALPQPRVRTRQGFELHDRGRGVSFLAPARIAGAATRRATRSAPRSAAVRRSGSASTTI